jgi:hypothetical protein
MANPRSIMEIKQMYTGQGNGRHSAQQNEAQAQGRPNFKMTPPTNLANQYNQGNTARSRTTDSWRGFAPEYNNIIVDAKSTKRPKAIPIFEDLAEHAIALSGPKASRFMPKEFQDVFTYLDLSNINAEYNNMQMSYHYNPLNDKYLSNDYSKTGLEKVFKFSCGALTMPKYLAGLGYNLNQIFVEIITSGDNTGNKPFQYMFVMYIDNSLGTSSGNKYIYRTDMTEFTLNGFAQMENIVVKYRDPAGCIIVPDPHMEFTILAVGAATTLQLANHNLLNGMLLYIDNTDMLKTTFPRTYAITVLNSSDISIPVDTTIMSYLIGSKIKIIIDDYNFNFNIQLFSVRRDRETA